MPLSPPAATPAGKRTVAAFDFDGTLTSGGSVLPFLVAVRGLWPVLPCRGCAVPKLAPLRAGGRDRGRRRQSRSSSPACSAACPCRWSKSAPPRSRSATWPATCDRTPGCACSGTSARGTTWSSSPPPRSATCAAPASSSGSTVSWPPVWPSAGADSSPATTRGRTAGGPRSTPGWSSISGPTACSAAARTSPSCGPMATVAATCASSARPTMASTPGCWDLWDVSAGSPGSPTWSGSRRPRGQAGLAAIPTTRPE